MISNESIGRLKSDFTGLICARACNSYGGRRLDIERASRLAGEVAFWEMKAAIAHAVRRRALAVYPAPISVSGVSRE